MEIDTDKLPGEPGWQTTVHCPAPTCAIATRNRQERYQKLVDKAPLPQEYRRLTFDDWSALSPDDMLGKWLGLGAARLFVDCRHDNFMFTLQDVCDAMRIPADAYRPSNDHLKNSIVFTGVNGVGKTSLAACVANHLRQEQIPALYERVANILDALKEHYNGGDKELEYDYGHTEQQTMNIFRQAPVLILDEFNLGRASDYARQKLEDIIRHRYAEHLPTIMTTNLDGDEFNDHWGLRVGHAVQGMAHWIPVAGVELRPRDTGVKVI